MTVSRRSFLKYTIAAPAICGLLSAFSLTAFAAGPTDTLRVGISKAAGNLDPHKYKGLWGAQDLMFEPLIGYGRNGELFPALATEWTVADDGKKLTLKLRENVTFQDGTPFNAEALEWNFKRWITVEDNNWMNVVRLYSGLNIIDPHNVEIAFKEPVTGMLYELTYVRPVRFLSPKAVGEDGAYKSPVGTGPWIEESASDEGSAFKRFDGYWGDKPAFSKLELKVLPDGRSRVAAMRAGEIDLLGGEFIAPVSTTEAETLKSSGMTVVVESGTTTMIMGFNGERNEALKDKRVRQAINLGFDRAAIATVLYGGLAKPAGSLFAEAVPMSGTRFDPPARDTEKAKALLEEAGWTGSPVRMKDGKPLSIELVVSEEQIAGSRAVGEVLQSQLGEAGIEIKIRSVDHASRHSDIPARKFDMAFFLTFGAPYEPYGTIVGLFLSTYDSGVDGKVFLDPVNLDPLVNGAMAAFGAESEPALQKMYDWLKAEDALVPVLYKPTIWAHSARVKGFAAPATEYDMPYEGISLQD